MCPFLFWRSEKHSSHDSGRSKETRPSWARSFQFSIHLTFTHIPLAKLSHKTKPHINMEMLGEGSKYLLNDNHSQLMIMFYFNCQPNRVSVWLVPSAFSLVIKDLLCLNPTLQSALDPSLLVTAGGFSAPSIFLSLLGHPHQQTCWPAPTPKHCPSLIFHPTLVPNSTCCSL